MWGVPRRLSVKVQRCRQPTDFPVTGYRSGCKRCGPSHDRDGLVYEEPSRFVTGERGGLFAAAGSVVNLESIWYLARQLEIQVDVICTGK